jgi:hypothetical protein
MAGSHSLEMEKFLKGVDYPAKKDDLIKKAEQNGADEPMRTIWQHLPDKQLNSLAQVSKAVAAINQIRGGSRSKARHRHCYS